MVSILPSVSLGVQVEKGFGETVQMHRLVCFITGHICDNKCHFPMSLHNCLIHYALDP